MFVKIPRLHSSKRPIQKKATMHISESSPRKGGIAIIGVSGRFPGANSVDEFWRNLLDGKDSVGKPPKERWYLRGDHEIESGYMKCRLDEFDGDFFSITPKECTFIDPQQRIILEVCWESLEDAGIPPSRLLGSTSGVFLGFCNNEYMLSLGQVADRKDHIYEHIGTTWSGTSGRLSHLLGLIGPSLAVEATCASSLVAIHTACQSLRNGECNLALSGGVNVLLEQPQKFPPAILSSRCKTFDERANGFAPAEGCAVFVLKRLEDAEKDGDSILGIIRGSSMAHDGNTLGLATPNPIVRAKCILDSMQMAGVEPKDIAYAELHGTGTSVGDVAESQSLIKVFSESAPFRNNPLLLGATKTNIGHALAASGAISLVKMLCTFKHRVVPKFCGFQALNPLIKLEKFAGLVPLETTPLEGVNGGPIIASINAFGITGAVTNMIVEEAPRKTYDKINGSTKLPIHLLNISAKTPEALKALCEDYQEFASTNELNFEDFVYSVNRTRDHFRHRISVTAKDNETFIRKLEEKNYTEGSVAATKQKMVFLFTGHGSQYVGMGKVLYESSPTFQTAFDKCAESFNSHFNTCLKTYLWAENENPNLETNRARMENPLLSQPANFCLQVALHHLWTKGFGIKPDIVLGLSFGEYAAAVASGVLTFDGAMSLVCKRCNLINQLPEGAMLALSASAQATSSIVASFLNEFPEVWVDIAGHNSETETIVSSTKETISKLKVYCEALLVKSKRLRSLHPFHSRVLDPILSEFKKFCQTITVSNPKCVYVSSIVAHPLKSKDSFSPKYWVNHLRNPVQYEKAIKALLKFNCTHFVEIGPHPVLCNLTLSNNVFGSENELVLCPSLRRKENDWSVLLGSLGKLYVAWNGTIDWRGLGSEGQQKMTIPHYPFQRKRHWMASTRTDNPVEDLLHPLLGFKLDVPNPSEQRFTNILTTSTASYLSDHTIMDQVVLPGAAYLETILGYGHRVLGSPLSNLLVEELQFLSPLVLSGDALKYNFNISGEAGEGSQDIEIFGKRHQKLWTKLCTAKLYNQVSDELAVPKLGDFFGAKSLDSVSIYETFQKCSIAMGPDFQTLSDIEIIFGSELRCRVTGTWTGDYVVHPCILDAMLQSAWYFNVQEQLSEPGLPLTLPSGIERVTFWDTPTSPFDFTIQVLADSSVVLYNAGQPLVKMERILFAQVNHQVFKTNHQAHPTIYHEKWIKVLTSVSQRYNTEAAPALDKNLEWVKSITEQAVKQHADFREIDARNQKLSYLYILRTFNKLGWAPKVKDSLTAQTVFDTLVVSKRPEFLRTMYRFLAILEEEGVLTRSGKNTEILDINDVFTVAVQPPNLEKVEDLLKSIPKPTDSDYIEYRLLKHCGQQLVEVFKDELHPLQLLFDTPSANASLLYQHANFSKIDSNTIRALLEGVLSNVKTPGAVLRVLEIGAGSGATTQEVLSKLKSLGVPFEYTFTDIGQAFLTEGERKFKAHKDSMVFRLLDIEKDPKNQGFAPGGFDIVVGSNVFHATVDLKATLTRCRELLGPRGYLFVTERMEKYRLFDLSFGLLDGWWRFNDFRNANSHPLIDFPTWEEVLGATGFSETFSILPSGCFVSRSMKTSKALVEHPDPAKTWIVYSLQYGTDVQELVRQLKEFNVNLIQVRPGAEYKQEENSATIRAGEYTDFETLGDSLKNVEGIVYMANSDNHLKTEQSFEQLEALQQIATTGLINLLKVHTLRLSSHRFILATRGVNSVTGNANHCVSPLYGTLQGIMKSFINEHTEFQCSVIDLNPLSSDPVATALQIISQLWVAELPRTIAFRGTEAWEPRFVPVPQTNEHGLSIPTSGTYQIVDDCNVKKTQLSAADLKVTIEFVGLNFRDILLSNNLLTGFPRHYGFEFAGTVSNQGTSKRFRVGDRVMGVASGGALGNAIAIKNENLLLNLPEGMSFKEGATIPLAYATAYYALVTLAKLKKGERVLIHTGSGGLGLAAIHVSKWLGCEIYTTVGNNRKRTFLRNSLGLTHVYDSRKPASYFEGILKDTNGEGVNVVLNTITGPGFIEASVKSMSKRNARFVELSKLNIWTTDRVKKLRPEAEYWNIDLAEIIVAGSPLIHEDLKSLEKLFQSGSLKPLPSIFYPVTQLRQAFKFFQGAQHIGKIVIAVTEKKLFNPESTYIITGGMGAIGLCTCELILEKGAKHVVLTGRSSPNEETEQKLAELRTKGTITIFKGDIGDYRHCKELVDYVASTPWSLRGIFHSAGVLADALVVNQRWENFQKAFKPKVIGGWNLHHLTKHLDLDYFVLYSSVAAVIGAPGQSSHSAANSFMDALAHHRVEECGLKALSINWGRWGQIGEGASITGGVHAKVHELSPEQGIAGLEAALKLSETQVCICDMEPDIGATLLPKLEKYFAGLLQHPGTEEKHIASRRPNIKSSASNFESLVGNIKEIRGDSDKLQAKVEALVEFTFRFFSGNTGESGKMDRNCLMSTMGMDSLLGMEVRSKLSKVLDVNITMSAFQAHNTITTLSKHILKLLQETKA